MASRSVAQAALQKNVRNALSGYDTGASRWTTPEILRRLPKNVQREVKEFPAAVSDVRDAFIAQEYYASVLRSRTRLTVGVTLGLGLLVYSLLQGLNEATDQHKSFADGGRKLVNYTSAQTPALFASAYFAEREVLDLFNAEVLDKVAAGKQVDAAQFSTEATALALKREANPSSPAYTLQRAMPVVDVE